MIDGSLAVLNFFDLQFSKLIPAIPIKIPSSSGLRLIQFQSHELKESNFFNSEFTQPHSKIKKIDYFMSIK